MRTLRVMFFLMVLLVATVFADRWRQRVLEDASRDLAALEEEFQEIQARFEGYWPRYERLEDALGVASNTMARLGAELAAERAANAPLRKQIEALSAERIAQAARETALKSERSE